MNGQKLLPSPSLAARRRKGVVAGGHWAFLETGKVPAGVPGSWRVKAHLRSLREVLHAEAGPMTASKGILIEQVVRTEGIQVLIERLVYREGFLKPDETAKEKLNLHPALRDLYLASMNTQRLALLGLAGIAKREPATFLDITELVKKEEAERRIQEGVKKREAKRAAKAGKRRGRPPGAKNKAGAAGGAGGQAEKPVREAPGPADGDNTGGPGSEKEVGG